MELIYIYIEKYRNYENTEFLLSGKFDVKYDKKNQQIFVERNQGYCNIYPDYISNINAIVGRNGVGKTNLIDLIGMKIADRNKNNVEYELRYKSKKSLGYRYPDEVEKEAWYTKYFFLYYMGTVEGKDEFIFECNCIDEFSDLFSEPLKDIAYYEGHLWFAGVCKTVNNGKLEFLYDLNTRKGDYAIESNKKITGDYRSEQDKLAIVSFRNNYNSDIYDRISMKPQDDYRISIPRRVAKLTSNQWCRKIYTLLNFMQKQQMEETMYSDKEYTIAIKYDSDILPSGDELLFEKIYAQVEKEEQYKCKILESFIYYLYYSVLEKQYGERVKKEIKKIHEVKTYKEACEEYNNLLDFLIGFFDNLDGEEKKIKDQYLELEKVLNCEDIEMNKTAIEIKINKKTDFSKIEPVIELLLDRGYKDCNFEDSFSVFSGFFEGKIDNLSDGEAYYLGIFSSILEQLEDPQFISNKENFLLLFDEPEMKMHPELARNFINQLIEFLGRTQNGKKFQILIATHSPFILSDMLPENILLLKKDESGCCHVEKCGISVFSANIHDILANGFFMNSTIGTYSKKILNEVIKSLYSDSDEEKIEKEKIDFIIKHIGEPILRDKLTSKYNEIYGDQKQDLGFDKYDLLKKIENLTEVSTENKKKIKKILHESFNGE